MAPARARKFLRFIIRHDDNKGPNPRNAGFQRPRQPAQLTTFVLLLTLSLNTKQNQEFIPVLCVMIDLNFT